MKYIQLFESFSDEQRDDDLVTYISYNIFENLISTGNIEEITDREVEKIENLIEQTTMEIESYEKVKRFRFDNVDSVASFDVNYLTKSSGRGYILFYKFKDDWWLVEMCTNHYYGKRKVESWLLDSMDGIEKWISNIIL